MYCCTQQYYLPGILHTTESYREKGFVWCVVEWSDPKTLFVFVLHKHKFVFVFVKELIFVPKTPIIGQHKMIFVTEV